MSQKKTGGLAGVVAGRTEIRTVGKEGAFNPGSTA